MFSVYNFYLSPERVSMRVEATYSHMNGEEFLVIRKPELWEETFEVVSSIDAEACKAMSSKQEGIPERTLFSSIELGSRFRRALRGRGWNEHSTTYQEIENEFTAQCVCEAMNTEKAKPTTPAKGSPAETNRQTDLLKERTALSVQIGTYSPDPQDSFANHLGFFTADEIDVGIRILPMEKFEAQLTSKCAVFEYDQMNLIQRGRGVPPVPLVLIGVQA